MKRLILDIEASNLLQRGLDYLQMPYRLKPDFNVWCIVLRDVDTGRTVKMRPNDLSKENLAKHLADCEEIVGHNIVGYDLPVLMLAGLLDYRIGYPGEPHVVNGKLVEVTDTLLWSKLLNADRLGGHSLKAWGNRSSNEKEEFHDFAQFTEEMLEYCVQDTNVNLSVYRQLIIERGEWDWTKPYSVEIKLADLTLRQELFGFHFNYELAEKNLVELDGLMQAIAEKVDPILPLKKMTKGRMADFEPPVRKFKANGQPSAFLEKFCAKIGATLDAERRIITFEGKEFDATADAPLKTTEPATIKDIDTVKAYLLSLGWVPSEVKERDLFKDSKKQKLEGAKLAAAVERYIEQSIHSEFFELRCELLGCSKESFADFIRVKMEGAKQFYVPTTPKLTVGVEKEICPNLISLGEKTEFVKDVVHYYTYRHRRNAIAGGVLDDDGEPETGFLSAVREDGRIPTPADTLGANTGRYRHKIVCNIPRVTSLYGENMRNLFESGPGLYQLGYDFASLEARIMGHYVLPYTDGPALAESLVAEKPNDVHTINAKKLGISRSDAKSVNYGCMYGAQPKKLSKMLGLSLEEGQQIFENYWNAVPALKELKEKVEKAWTASGKTFIKGLDGRKLVTRSKHSLINVLFQSGGAIAAKWSTVRLAQHMENQGILGDPLKHTKEDPKVWFMIHVHDEQQLAVHPSLLQVTNYPTEEDAKANCPPSCGIGHGKKGYYTTGRTAPIECIAAGIEDAKNELSLRVDLGFEYISGRSWGACH